MNSSLEGLPSHGGSLPMSGRGYTTPLGQSSGSAHPDDGREVIWIRGLEYPVHPARSQHPTWAPLLAREVSLRWRDPEGLHLPWLREWPAREHPQPMPDSTWALTLDGRGRVARYFTAATADLDAYSQGFGSPSMCGPMTCPREGVLPRSIVVGKPAQPAHKTLVGLVAAGIGLGEVFPRWFGPDDQLLSDRLQGAR